MALTRSTDPLVWIDCEMTGLDPSSDTIMSISCILTTSELLPLDPTGFDAIIKHTPQQLSSMSEWCTRTHSASGLWQSCLASTTTAHDAAQSLLAYIKHFIPDPKRALLAGNSIHADRAFLAIKPWDVVLEHLHYRLFDVSATKEMMRRWASVEVLERAPTKKLAHTAREDVWESLEEARYYKGLIESLKGPETAAGGGGEVGGNRTGIATGGMRASAAVGSGNSNSKDSLAAQGGAPIMGMGMGMGMRTKQAQEQFDMMRNNGNRDGDVGQLDEGFRTDVA